MKNAGMLEIVDLPAGITALTFLSERKYGYPLDAVMTSSFLHDMRNPLSTICGCAELLLDGNLGPAASRRVASNVHRAAGRMQELIADVARIARGEAARDESSNLRAVLVASCEAAGLGEHHAIDILLDVPAAIEIPQPASRLKSVFMNLIINAVEAMAGGGTIRITAIETLDEVRIEVEDNGPGIPPEIRDRLFEPFVTARKEHGLGLGLALSLQTVRELGGDLCLEPAPGARFLISLPRGVWHPSNRHGEGGR